MAAAGRTAHFAYYAVPTIDAERADRLEHNDVTDNSLLWFNHVLFTDPIFNLKFEARRSPGCS
jgi:hypothetical protein